MTDLKPCPFCGSNEIMDMRYSGDARVQCSGCNASTDTYGDHAESHKAWNRRAIPVGLLKKLGNCTEPDCCIAYERGELRALLGKESEI